MRVFEVLKNVALRGGIVLAALVGIASSATAQTQIELTPEAFSAVSGAWVVSNAGAPPNGGLAMRHPDKGAAKLAAPLASPTHFFEMTFTAVPGVPYRLWLFGRADKDNWANDSVFVQFSNSVTKEGAPIYRIGTTSATEINLEECSGCGLKKEWAWQDNGWGKGVLGPHIYFDTAGPQRIRVQTREDGLSIDHMTLTPEVTKQPTASSSTLLKVAAWNTHHGLGTDGKYDLNRFVTHIVKSGANVVALSEVEKKVGSYGNEDQPARYAALLKTATGKTWYYTFAQRDGKTTGQGNLILSTFPIEDAGMHQLSYSRSVSRARILVNGISVTVFATHLDADSAAKRTTQMKELLAIANAFPQQWVFAGDFNAWPGATEIKTMTAGNIDAWAQATADGTQVAYSGNAAGNTRNSRIDYVFYSKQASKLKLKGAQVFDTRDAKGVMPSDHRPVMATFEVK